LHFTAEHGLDGDAADVSSLSTLTPNLLKSFLSQSGGMAPLIEL
jgi:hypothetical protein